MMALLLTIAIGYPVGEISIKWFSLFEFGDRVGVPANRGDFDQFVNQPGQ
jgi:hypothetical protein